MKAEICDVCKLAVLEGESYTMRFRELFLYQTKHKKGSPQTKRGKRKRKVDMCPRCTQEMMKWINKEMGIEDDAELYWVKRR